MHLHRVATSALALVGRALAFSDSSPLVLFSTMPFANAPERNHLQTSSQAVETIKSLLHSCPTDKYHIITQPGLNARDLQQPSSRSLSTPNLQKVATNPRVKGTYTVSEVIGDISSDEVFAYIDAACSRMGQEVSITEQRLASLPLEDRIHALAENDALLADKLDGVTKDDSFTILLLSTAPEPSYEADFHEPVKMELKRNVAGSKIQRADNETNWDSRSLFEKYQFFTPGIFMAIITAIILLSTLYIGLSALSSLEVSYGAFDKEMGPAAQKKQ